MPESTVFIKCCSRKTLTFAPVSDSSKDCSCRYEKEAWEFVLQFYRVGDVKYLFSCFIREAAESFDSTPLVICQVVCVCERQRQKSKAKERTIDGALWLVLIKVHLSRTPSPQEHRRAPRCAIIFSWNRPSSHHDWTATVALLIST